MAVQITKSDLSAKVEAGWKKAQLARHYGLPVAQMTRVLKEADLTIRKFHAPKYLLVDDAVEDATSAEAPEEVTIEDSATEEVPQQVEETVEEETTEW